MSLVLKECCTCTKRQNVRANANSCLNCGGDLKEASPVSVAIFKRKKKHFRRPAGGVVIRA